MRLSDVPTETELHFLPPMTLCWGYKAASPPPHSTETVNREIVSAGEELVAIRVESTCAIDG